jgi:Protein of unknown function (DUF3592)
MVMTYIAVGLMVIGLALGLYQLQQLSGKVITMGKVYDLPESRGNSGKSGKKERVTFGVAASFKNHAGQEFNYISSWSSSHPGYRVGDPIKLFYNRDSPEQNGLCSFNGRLGFAYFLFGIGLAIGGLTWGYSYSAKLFDAKYRVTDQPELVSQTDQWGR